MSQADLGGKLFAYAIRYTSKEGIANPDQGQFPGKDVSARYNGNVVEADWRAVEKIGVNPSMTPKRYGYVYDSLNRLTAGYYQNPDNPYSKENTESASYDLNGNIINMYRTSLMQAGSGTATVIDNLTYAYAGNRLLSVSDAAYNFTGYEGGGAEITYDGNGNMLSIPDKGISSIKYNYLNLSDYLHVNRFGEEDITIQTLYRADGTRVSKENLTTVTGYNGSTTVRRTTEYLDGFQYFRTENLSSGGGSESRLSNTQSARAMQPQAFTPEFLEPVGTLSIKTPDLQFFATAEGFYDYTKDQYIYSYTDHLGNVRVSYGRNSAGALEIVDANDYYPFGMNHLKSGKAIFGQGSYKNYKFSGKELQETGMYDFGARMYMPDLGRWGVVDPLAEQMRRYSPYNYAFDNPMNFVDPDGMMPRRLTMANPDSPLDYQQSPSYNPNWMGMGDNVGYGDSYGFGAVYSGGGGGSSTFGETQLYKDIMAYLVQPETDSGNYFQGINFIQFMDNNENHANQSAQLSDPIIGKKVLAAKTTFLGRLWAMTEPRTWTENGITYNVDADGKISGVRHYQGDAPFSLGGSGGVNFFRYSSKALKNLISTEKGAQSAKNISDIAAAMKKRRHINIC